MAERCRAHSSRTGERCKLPPVRGATVCRSHGGAARQVQDAARERLQAMVLPALATLRKLIDSADSDAVKLAAIKAVLDYTGHKIPEKLETDGHVTIEVEYVSKPLPSLQQPHHNGHVVQR